MADVITQWSEFFISDMGLALRQAAFAHGLRPAFIYAEIGEGVPPDPSEIPLMTALALPARDEKGATIKAPVKRSLSIGSTHHVDIVIDNKDYKTAIIMREIALYAMLENPNPDEPEDPDLAVFFKPVLYGYSYTLKGYESIPTGKEFHRIWTIGADVAIARSKEISIIYDGSTIYVSHEDIDDITKMVQDSYDASQKALAAIQEGGGVVSAAQLDEVRELAQQASESGAIHVSADEPEDWKAGEWWYRILRSRNVSTDDPEQPVGVLASTSTYDPNREHFIKTDGNTETLESADNGELIVDIQ